MQMENQEKSYSSRISKRKKRMIMRIMTILSMRFTI